VKNNQEPGFGRSGHFEWHNLNIYFTASASKLHFCALCPSRFVRFDRATNRGAQVRHQGWPRKLEEIECRRTRRVFEKQLRAAAELLHLHVLIDYHRRRRVGAEHDAVGHFQKVATEVCASSGCRSGSEVREFKTTMR